MQEDMAGNVLTHFTTLEFCEKWHNFVPIKVFTHQFGNQLEYAQGVAV